MKKLIQNNIVCFIIGAILFSGITAYASYKIYANDVAYEPSNENFEARDVKAALDSLYEKQNTTIQDLNKIISDLKSQENNKVASGSFTITTPQTVTITTNFKPSKVFVVAPNFTTGFIGILIYDSDYLDEACACGGTVNSTNASCWTEPNFKITNDGFLYTFEEIMIDKMYWYAIQ